MDPIDLVIGFALGAFVIGALISNLKGASDYNKGYAKSDEEWETHHEREVGAWRKKYEKGKAEQTTKNAALEGKITKLGGQVQDLTSKLKQLEASKVKEIAKTVESERAKLQTDFDLRKQALEPKVRAEAEAEWRAKFVERRAEVNEIIDAFAGIALDNDGELMRLYHILPRTDTLAVLMKAKGNKTMLTELQIAEGIDTKHFENEVETKYRVITRGGEAGTGRPLGPAAAQILELLKKQRARPAQIVQITGIPKSTASEALKALRKVGAVDQDSSTGEYYAK